MLRHVLSNERSQVFQQQLVVVAAKEQDPIHAVGIVVGVFLVGWIVVGLVFLYVVQITHRVNAAFSVPGRVDATFSVPGRVNAAFSVPGSRLVVAVVADGVWVVLLGVWTHTVVDAAI